LLVATEGQRASPTQEKTNLASEKNSERVGRGIRVPGGCHKIGKGEGPSNAGAMICGGENV